MVGFGRRRLNSLPAQPRGLPVGEVAARVLLGEGLRCRPREPLDDGIAKGHQVCPARPLPGMGEAARSRRRGPGPESGALAWPSAQVSFNPQACPPWLGVSRIAQALLRRVLSLRASQQIHLLSVAGRVLPLVHPWKGRGIGRRTGHSLHVASLTSHCGAQCLHSSRRAGCLSDDCAPASPVPQRAPGSTDRGHKSRHR